MSKTKLLSRKIWTQEDGLLRTIANFSMVDFSMPLHRDMSRLT